MKKMIQVLVILNMILIIAGCSGKTDTPVFLNKVGIAPYELSESNAYVLKSFGMADTSQIITFKAPEEAVSLNVRIYYLEEGSKWADIGGGGISIGADRNPEDQLTGTFTMQLKENYAIEFHIYSDGLASYKTDEIILNSEIIASIKGFLQEFKAIEMNREIPVALMVYDQGTNMESYSLEDFYEPSKFAGMDLVQAVTLEFSDHIDP